MYVSLITKCQYPPIQRNGSRTAAPRGMRASGTTQNTQCLSEMPRQACRCSLLHVLQNVNWMLSYGYMSVEGE